MAIAVHQQRLELALERIQRAFEQRRAQSARAPEEGLRAGRLEGEVQALRQETARLATALRAAEAQNAALHQLCDRAAERVDNVIRELHDLKDGKPWPK